MKGHSEKRPGLRSFSYSHAGVIVAFLEAGRYIALGMNDKEMALESIQRLPADVKLEVIAKRLEFLAAIRTGLEQIERGETVPHEEVKRQLAEWLSK
jgi:predicted transcriptional regulator